MTQITELYQAIKQALFCFKGHYRSQKGHGRPHKNLAMWTTMHFNILSYFYIKTD